MPPPYFQDDLHALHEGMLIGALIRKGINVRPKMDDQGNYTDELAIYFSSEDDNEGELIVVFVKVLPLPQPDAG